MLFGFYKALFFKFLTYNIVAFFGIAQNHPIAKRLTVPVQDQGTVIHAVVLMFVPAFGV